MLSQVDQLRLANNYTTCRNCAEFKRRFRGVPVADTDGNIHIHINHTPEIRCPEWDKPKTKHHE